ncbi:MAG: NAD(P)/FAD-dependent oxidoreductase [Candidatus Marsarchaeota archaeon]|jgi:flavin-dependent dehydrogenase|nr:NAD(P)/FAD-dependent oxidoreductase [Candidatus Marsarchaeota archaeon]
MTQIRKIVGGGLSGLATAIALAHKGETVTVYERSKTIGTKFPESVHAFRNYNTFMDENDFIKSRGFIINNLKPIHKIIKFGPSLKFSETYSKDKPLFYATKRGNVNNSLDYQLSEQAKNLNVEFQFGTTNNKSFDVIATGAAFATEMGYGHHYTDVNVKDDTIIFLLNDYFAPKGYAYAIPYGKNEISIVTTSFVRSSFNSMSTLFDRLIDNVPAFSELIESGKRGPAFAKIGFSYLPKTAKVKNSLLVGEAAGFSEADRGFGMHYALESGFLAAKAITERSDYDELWKTSFESNLIVAFKRRLILNNLGNEQYDKLANTGTAMSSDEYLKHKKAQTTNMFKQILDNLHTANEIKKHRKMFDITQLNERLWNLDTIPTHN